MIKNIVFDIGNVLSDFRLKEFLTEKGFDAMMIRRILKASIMSPFWEQFERAELTEQEAMDAFIAADPEIKEDLVQAFSDISGMLTIRDFAIPLVRSLKDLGYRVYYLSNYSGKAFSDCKDSLAFLPYTDGGVLSFQAHMTKPDPNIYRYFLNKFHLDAKECLFVDDTEENVAAAVRLGFHGIVFSSYNQMISEFKLQNVIL